MKKTTLLLAAAWMLLLWFVPESAWADPEPKTVSIYQSGFKRGTKLLYPLTPTTVGGITYTPVDMGAGVAWADRNVGAENPEDAGTNFYWGDISGEESFSSAVGDNKYYTQARNMTSQTSILPLEYDAAYKTLGANWRMPTKQEMGTLWNFDFYPPGDSNIGGVNKNYFIQQSYDENKGITCTYQFEPEKTILIPFSYEYSPENQSSSKNIRFWTSLVGNLPNNSYSSPQNIPAVVYSGTSDGGGWNSTKISHGLPVRPVYVPTCETCTLKIGIQTSGRYCILYGNDGTCWEDEAGTITYWFDYICEKGQQVTVNPIGNTGYVFDQWKASNNSTVVNVPGNVFTVTENATYYATFREQGWNITWNNYDGTELAVTDTRAGSIPEYTGATPTKPAPGGVDWKYVHSGWTPALVAATGDATYTATFSQGYTLSTETGGKGTVTLTASGYPDRTGSGDYATGTSVTMTATPNDGAGFVRWSDNGSTNPVRTVEVNGNVTYTAVFGLESPDASVDVYENASVDKTKILHSLNPTTVGKITYNPIDLGYGVAWADKNVGAATENAAGNYFTWGKTTPITQYGVYENIANVDVGYILSETEDAATVNIGDTWRMPTNSEWEALLNNTNVSGTTTFINKTDENLSITLPLSGVYMGYNSISYQNTYGYYWGSELMSKYYEESYYYYNWNPYEESGASLFTTHGGSAYYINTGSLYMATPIRAIYQPKYNVKTLTIIANGHNYVYKCQEGQSVTVTANATTEGHVFDKWTEDNDTHATRTFVMTDNITRTATFKEAPTGSTVSIVADNTGYGSVDVATINNVPDNSPITVSSNTLTINNTTVTANVTESNTAQYTYTFTGWTDDKGKDLPEKVTGGLTIRANFTQTTNTYTVTWKNGETTLETDENVPYGETPSYDGETPTKDEDAENTYTFDAWSPAIAEVTGNTTYTATFTATPKPAELHIVLKEAEDDNYYNDFATRYGGKTANTVTLNRQFEQGRWSTLCLPFEVSGGMMTTLKMSGRVYEFKYATGNANVGEGVNLYFSNAKKMEAGKGYIVNANATLAEKTSFVFSNVKIDVTADSVKPLNSATAYNKLPGYKSEGTIELVGTLRNGTLKGTESGNTYMGLKSNKIYYPNISQGSTIWAYRGIFRSSKTLNIEKMRIIVDGEDRGEIIIDADGDVRAPSDAPSRKFIRDGVLYIEREGVVYDAQGKRVEGSF